MGQSRETGGREDGIPTAALLTVFGNGGAPLSEAWVCPTSKLLKSGDARLVPALCSPSRRNGGFTQVLLTCFLRIPFCFYLASNPLLRSFCVGFLSLDWTLTEGPSKRP